MNEELIKHQLDEQETRLNDHSKRIETPVQKLIIDVLFCIL